MTNNETTTAARALIISYSWCWAVVFVIGVVSAGLLGLAAGAGDPEFVPLFTTLGSVTLAITLIVAAHPGGLTRRRRHGRRELDAEQLQDAQWQVLAVNSCGTVLSRREVEDTIARGDFNEDALPDRIYVARRLGLTNPLPAGEPMPEDFDYDDEVAAYYDVQSLKLIEMLNTWTYAEEEAEELNDLLG